MLNHLTTINRCAFAFGLALLCAHPVLALDLFKDTLPQADTKSCQSYSMALALNQLGDPEYKFDTFQALRDAEGKFLDILTAKGDQFNHNNWVKAVEEFTQDAYTLKIETHPDLVAWMGRVKELTSQTSTTDVLLSQITGNDFPVVLTSVTNFAGSSYKDGHIIAVLGIAGSGLDSTTEIVAFNGGIKGQNNVNRCEAGQQPGDLKYSAGVVSSNSFALKDFQGFRILRIVPK
jgi:hypothetical protein